MWIKKVNLAVYLVCALALGYGACALFGTLSADGSLLSGDIAKADLYSGQKQDPDVAAVEEKLQNDEEFLKQTQEAMGFLKQRIDVLSGLTERTMNVCGDVAEFQQVLEGVSSLQVKAYNATLALDKTEKELQKVADGKTSNLYEQASNNAFLGVMKIENQLGVGKEFVETASKYLDSMEGTEKKMMTQLVADWTEYCLQDAVLNGSAEETAYWVNSAEKMNAEVAQLLKNTLNSVRAAMSENVIEASVRDAGNVKEITKNMLGSVRNTASQTDNASYMFSSIGYMQRAFPADFPSDGNFTLTIGAASTMKAETGNMLNKAAINDN